MALVKVSKKYFLFNMVGFLWALGDHCPCLLHASLNMRTLTAGCGGHLVLPRGHLLVVTGGCFEPLQRLVKTGSGLDGAVVAWTIGGGDLRLTVVGHVARHVATWMSGGWRVNLSVGGEGVARRRSAVVVSTGLITKNKNIKILNKYFRPKQRQIYFPLLCLTNI